MSRRGPREGETGRGALVMKIRCKSCKSALVAEPRSVWGMSKPDRTYAQERFSPFAHGQKSALVGEGIRARAHKKFSGGSRGETNDGELNSSPSWG